MILMPRRQERRRAAPVAPTLKLIAGPSGDTGDRGERGEIGHRGEKGDRGLQGLMGLSGMDGQPGQKGDQGDPGARGDIGARGPRGLKGDRGTDGDPGRDADNDATYLTREDETKTLPNSERLVAGTNIRFDRSQKGQLILHSDSRVSVVGGGAGTGTGSGIIIALVEGDGIAIDATDPSMPVVGVSAPQDGTTYGIKDGSWVPVATDAAQIEYFVQTEASKHWLDSDFVFGNNVIGVRTAGALVYLPHDLSSRKLVSVKDESGGGATVYPY